MHSSDNSTRNFILFMVIVLPIVAFVLGFADGPPSEYLGR